MGGELIGLVAVTLGMGVPLGALYTYYRVRKLRSEERLAAIARPRLHRNLWTDCHHPGGS